MFMTSDIDLVSSIFLRIYFKFPIMTTISKMMGCQDPHFVDTSIPALNAVTQTWEVILHPAQELGSLYPFTEIPWVVTGYGLFTLGTPWSLLQWRSSQSEQTGSLVFL